MIHQEMGLTDKQNQDMTLYLKNFGQIIKNKQNAVVIEPFDSDGRICN
jgi:frataxin-like iron-binding protein CyaY